MRKYSEVAVDVLSRQHCNACWRADGFNFHVPDGVWQSVVPELLLGRVVCLACFDKFALERDIDYASHLEVVYFAGEKACFSFDVSTASSGP